MNESFFGQYSVFAVFGSVVGCVVVPLIAQVLQQQSMECMILSAIVLSLTAAHLNKKGVNEKDCSKILFTKELEKKKLNHNNNNNKKHKHHTPHSQHTHNSSHQYLQQEQEYMQQHEHLKVVEMEKRSEEKRLKKIRKREERLKKREEENRKQKESEERYRTLKDKRMKQKENLYKTTNNSYYNSSVACLEKYCHPNDGIDKRQHYGLKTVDESTTRRQSSYISNSQRIPRFERTRTASMENPSSSKHSQQHCSNRSITGSLTIGCSNLSASCSSLSSISSSGSSSPPLPASPPPACNNGAWRPSLFNTVEISPNKAPVQQSSWTHTNTVVPPCHLGERGLKSYSSGRQTKRKLSSFGFDSSSLFCSQGQTNPCSEQNISGEYSLFGPQKFSNALPKQQ